jgi:hypothetical protein
MSTRTSSLCLPSIRAAPCHKRSPLATLITGISFLDFGNTVLGVFGLLVGLLAIPGSIKGAQAIKEMREMREDLKSAITDLKGEVETHYIDNFPVFIPKIVQILGEAKKTITIFCDMPAYGVVSDPRGFRRYARVIQDKAEEKDIVVRMLHLNAPGRAATREIEFKDPWEKLGEEERVAAFIGKSRKKLDGADPKNDFLALIEERQVEALKSFKEAGVDADETDLIMPLYFWIVDGEKAVFALTEFSEEAHEPGFRTRSEKMIGAMEGIFERYYGSRTEEARGGESAAAVV